MLKNLIKGILLGDSDGGAVDTNGSTLTGKSKKKPFYESLSKVRGGKTDAGREALAALEEEE